MFKVIVKDTYEEMSEEAFKIVKEILANNEKPVLGLATGSTPVGLYKEMIKDHKENGTSYKNCISFNLDEYVGLPRNHEQSYWTFMHENLFNEIDELEENIHVPCGEGDDIEANAKEYEDEMKKHVVDVQILGIGSDGHIAFNEPGTPFDSETHITPLTQQTINDNARFFNNDPSLVPTSSITQGLGTIMRSKKIILLATGKNKAEAIKGMLKGPKTTDCPASVLQDHSDVTVILDHDAASLIEE